MSDTLAPNSSTLSEVISQKFPTFDHQGVITEPFETESKRDVEFQENLNTRLIELMLEFHAWSSARPIHSNENTAHALEKEMNGIIETENEQGMSRISHPSPQTVFDKTRQRLSEFVERIKMALAALTGF